MTISISPELERFVSDKVESGLYPSADDVVIEALRRMEEYDAQRADRIAAFNDELGRRLTLMDLGEVVDPEEVRLRLQRRFEERSAIEQ